MQKAQFSVWDAGFGPDHDGSFAGTYESENEEDAAIAFSVDRRASLVFVRNESTRSLWLFRLLETISVRVGDSWEIKE